MTKAQQNSIQVDVSTHYIEGQSNPAEDNYVFSYTITIRNTGSTGAQLISRHWLITDADGGVQEVFGEGVVGQQPFLQPGEDFSYTSGTSISTPVGTMQGSYQMRSEAGITFEAPISPFTLAMPHILH
ncbi:Co2+/Mg2+ efflux protein ApaG [Sedimenticola selenatireducens]|uniref:Protein ApaG n=1 Tax=Sedimenticola selenatireducens TaxID=191960 RepID=A0A557SI35_9GAMM|nr:Co2+/Mg2+ efflux protein ApaG [Sedimenticola selenatireducens]TVO77097.1 Co2+/Mg2+ efflux protein ApaG [Sedimenticola selenatireducens]TVT64541.1 MAG: Co2+/Mg2+ efflux protein ApaG [Sedimenticola selenatireducens]